MAVFFLRRFLQTVVVLLLVSLVVFLGLYAIGNFGVRIEDDVLITEDGYKSLTNFPKELMVLPC